MYQISEGVSFLRNSVAASVEEHQKINSVISPESIVQIG